MKLAILFSGGKDSSFAFYKAMKKNEIVCLITLISKNPESYMFHTPNINLAEVQAQAIGLPLLTLETEGKKEEELKDLKKAIELAKEKYGIEGIVTGAVRSAYQSTRIQKLCDELNLKCINPIWQIDLKEYLDEFISSGFKAMIVGVFSYPFDESWLGKILDKKTVEELLKISETAGINIAGEGGEFETFVFDGPIFKKRIEVLQGSKTFSNYSGIYKIEKVRLVEKH
jgi:ABC transporter with metal-binding/Fe-S-binding domain ATP-binding protein